MLFIKSNFFASTPKEYVFIHCLTNEIQPTYREGPLPQSNDIERGKLHIFENFAKECCRISNFAWGHSSKLSLKVHFNSYPFCSPVNALWTKQRVRELHGDEDRLQGGRRADHSLGEIWLGKGLWGKWLQRQGSSRFTLNRVSLFPSLALWIGVSTVQGWKRRGNCCASWLKRPREPGHGGTCQAVRSPLEGMWKDAKCPKIEIGKKDEEGQTLGFYETYPAK